MKRVNFLSLALVILTFFSGCGKADKIIKVITFNIRYDNPRDSINAWPNRLPVVCDFLNSEKADLFGLQEALWYQFEAIDSALTGYSSVAVGRDDGKKKGEMNPVFYRIDRFDYVRDSTFWLSQSPGIPGTKGWGASLPRIVTWVQLTDKLSGKTLYYFNTHFAHDSDSARVMSAGILLKQVKRLAGKENFIITGDFNSTPDSRAYFMLTEKNSKKPLMKDAYVITETAPAGPLATFNNWNDDQPGNRIDYVFVKNGKEVKSVSTVVRKNGQVFISDHWPVVSVIK